MQEEEDGHVKRKGRACQKEGKSMSEGREERAKRRGWKRKEEWRGGIKTLRWEIYVAKITHLCVKNDIAFASIIFFL